MRQIFTASLLTMALMMALLPLTANRSFTVRPDNLLPMVLDEEVSLSADYVARLIVEEDTTFRLIDVRQPEDYREVSLPGAINVPYSDLIQKDPDIYLNNKDISIIFYSNDDLKSNLALVYARGLGYRNCFVLSGGMNGWFKTVVESRFSGERITARENSLYEIRTKAARLFIGLNNQPDSLRTRYLESGKFSKKKLDGGCE